MMKAHFFDLDSILLVNAKVWIIDKTIPNIPLIKISQSDFSLIKSGIYKSQGNQIDFGGHTYWITTSLFEKIKIKCKNHRTDISNLPFSMQEFMNKELIENLDYDINFENIQHLKDTDDDIYVICSKNTQTNYELMISKIEDKLKENGLLIKKYYYISETFYNRNEDSIAHKKVRLLLQHLLGYKTDGNKFVDEKLEKYDEIFYYDDDTNSIRLAKDCNKLLMVILSNTESTLKDLLKQELKETESSLIVNEVTSNKVNKFIVTKVVLKFSNLIKVFDSFKWR